MSGPRLREARAAIVADASLRGADLGAALARLLDDTLRGLHGAVDTSVATAVVALGSYGRRELCPGSDVDVLLLHEGRARDGAAVGELAERLWYPLWDAGFVTGHGARTVKASIALADTERDVLTALLEARHVCGEARLTAELVRRSRELAHRRRDRLLADLGDASARRRAKPGPVAEVLEPDVKDGAGGLRDIQALAWAGVALGSAPAGPTEMAAVTVPAGVDGLVRHGILNRDDAARLDTARTRLLDVRVELHRATGGRSDCLALQEQDTVAAALGAPDADALVRDLAAAAREVAWIARHAWSRITDARTGPSGRHARPDRPVADGVVLRDGRVVFTGEEPLRALQVLDAAVAATAAGTDIDRSSLARLATMQRPQWDVWERAAFLRLLRAGAPAVRIFEALDHEGALVELLPEWERVRSRPQRNAYHRYTIDRHLLEAVAECAVLLDAGDGDGASFDGVVARACRRPELLLLGALLHDIGKGLEGDHTAAGAAMAAGVARRIGLDSEGREIVEWLVRNHLLMADLATRRDLSDASVADNLAVTCAGDPERLRLLYLLTIGDSRATGPAAWSPSKAALVRDLFVKAATAIERGAATVVAHDRRERLVARLGQPATDDLLATLPDAYLLAFEVDEIVEHRRLLAVAPVVRCAREDGHVTITVVAPDHPGLLTTLAGAVTLCGLDVHEANLFSTTDGLALDVFRVADPFGRLSDGTERVERAVLAALGGGTDIEARVSERRRSYARAGAPGPVSVVIDNDTSPTDTLVEVHGDDDVGLLYRVAGALTEMGVDVRVAKVATLGARVVDVFYVRNADGRKITRDADVERVRAGVLARMTQ